MICALFAGIVQAGKRREIDGEKENTTKFKHLHMRVDIYYFIDCTVAKEGDKHERKKKSFETKTKS